MLDDSAEEFPSGEIQLAMPNPPRAAIDYMSIYILGAQPQLVAYHYSRWHLSKPARSDEEPDNVGFYGWDAALRLMRERTELPTPSTYRQVLGQMAVRASAKSYAHAERVGLTLPLRPPLHFRQMPNPIWEPAAQWFIDRNDAIQMEASDQKHFRPSDLPDEAKRILIGMKRLSVDRKGRIHLGPYLKRFHR